MIYFKGSVLALTTLKSLNQFLKNKFDFVFSDALHEPHAVNSEYQLIIKNNLNENFLIYYDDLDFEGLEAELKILKKDLENSTNKK